MQGMLGGTGRCLTVRVPVQREDTGGVVGKTGVVEGGNRCHTGRSGEGVGREEGNVPWTIVYTIHYTLWVDNIYNIYIYVYVLLLCWIYLYH
jgi:hypothetical protein